MKAIRSNFCCEVESRLLLFWLSKDFLPNWNICLVYMASAKYTFTNWRKTTFVVKKDVNVVRVAKRRFDKRQRWRKTCSVCPGRFLTKKYPVHKCQQRNIGPQIVIQRCSAFISFFLRQGLRPLDPSARQDLLDVIPVCSDGPKSCDLLTCDLSFRCLDSTGAESNLLLAPVLVEYRFLHQWYCQCVSSTCDFLKISSQEKSALTGPHLF